MAISRALAAAALACVGLGCDVGSPRAPVLDPVALPDSAPTLAVEVGTGEGVFEPIAQLAERYHVLLLGSLAAAAVSSDEGFLAVPCLQLFVGDLFIPEVARPESALQPDPAAGRPP